MKYFALIALLGYSQATKMDLTEMAEEADEFFNEFEQEMENKPADFQLLQEQQEINQGSSSSSSSSSSGSDEETEIALAQQHRQQMQRQRAMHRRQVMAQGRARRVAEMAEDFEGWPADMHEFPGNNNNGGQWRDAYVREIPGNFVVDEDNHHVDTFTANVLQNYAHEGVTADGKPSGHFFITKDQTKTLAREVVETHLGYRGDQLNAFMKKKFGETWEHYDVNEEGTLDALWASTFMRALCKSEKDIDLQ